MEKLFDFSNHPGLVDLATESSSRRSSDPVKARINERNFELSFEKAEETFRRGSAPMIESFVKRKLSKV